MRADKLMLLVRNADPARRLEPLSPARREELKQSIIGTPVSPSRLADRTPRRRLILILGVGLIAAVAARRGRRLGARRAPRRHDHAHVRPRAGRGVRDQRRHRRSGRRLRG